MTSIVEQPKAFEPRGGQKGSTLLTALVMLVVLTLLVISAMNSSTVNLRIAGNMQIKEEAIAAAQQATEQIVSYNFTSPTYVAPSSGIPVTIGGTTYSVAVSQPVCNTTTPMMNNYINLPDACLTPAPPPTGMFFGTGSGASTHITAGSSVLPSKCSIQTWDLGATVTDPRTGATAATHQGVAVDVRTAGSKC